MTTMGGVMGTNWDHVASCETHKIVLTTRIAKKFYGIKQASR